MRTVRPRSNSVSVRIPFQRLKRVAATLTFLALNVATPVGVLGGAGPAYGASTAGAVLGQVDLSPTAEGLPGGAMMQKILNWTGQFGLWGSLAAILVGAAIWGVSQQFGNGFQTGKGKVLVGAGAIGAVLTGLAAIIVNTLFTAANAG